MTAHHATHAAATRLSHRKPLRNNNIAQHHDLPT